MMGIDKMDSIVDPNDVAMTNKILDSFADQAEGTIYTSTLPTTATVPLGKKVVYDDGAGTKRIYWKTGQGNLGYVALT